MQIPYKQLAVCCIVSAMACLNGCDESSPPSSSSVEPPPAAAVPTSTGPVFTLTEPILDFGSINDFESRTVPVEFTNTGDSVLTVNRVQPTCGCTTTSLDKKDYAPGERGTINLTFKPKGSGPQTKYVKVHTNDIRRPVQSLKIKSIVQQTVMATPRIFSLKDISLGHPYITSAILESDNPTYAPTSISISGDLKTFSTATIDAIADAPDGKRQWRINLTLDGTLPWGWHTGSATVRGTVKTPDGIQPQRYTMGMHASVAGTLRADDPMFRLITLQPGESVRKTMRLSTVDGTAFQIRSASVQGGGAANFTAVAEPLTPDRRAWTVTLSGTAPLTRGVVKGHVIVQTDVPGEEAIGLLFSGNIIRKEN